MNSIKEAWEKSYLNKDNYLFYPNEEVIRFFSKYIYKQVGLDLFKKKHLAKDPKLLVFGCGIGRHVIYSYKLGINTYGIDLSDEAINFTKKWCQKEGFKDYENKILCCDGRNTPFKENYFDFGVSHGVIDSMDQETIKLSIKELYRILKPNSLFYFDLIGNENNLEENVITQKIKSKHEKNTFQTYFNENSIKSILENLFDIIDIKKVTITKPYENDRKSSRFHLVIKPKK